MKILTDNNEKNLKFAKNKLELKLMKTFFKLIAKVISLIIVIFIFSACAQLSQLQNMSKCEFRLKNLELKSLDNTDISNVKSVNDLNVLTVARLGNSLLSGRLPLTYTANIEANNPNTQKAALNKFDLIVLLNNVQLVQTSINQYVEILPKQQALIPITLTSDIANILKGENINRVLSILFPQDNSQSVLTFKIKPSIKVGPSTISYPGYITLNKNFKAV